MSNDTKPKKRITVQSAKAKGRKFQQLIASYILRVFGDILQTDDVRSCSMGANGEDILLSPAARQLYPYSNECKHQERGFTPLYDAFEQASKNSKGLEPVVHLRMNRKEPLTVVSTKHFFDLMEKLHHYDTRHLCDHPTDLDGEDRSSRGPVLGKGKTE